jgi:hypothetical protein
LGCKWWAAPLTFIRQPRLVNVFEDHRTDNQVESLSLEEASYRQRVASPRMTSVSALIIPLLLPPFTPRGFLSAADSEELAQHTGPAS